MWEKLSTQHCTVRWARVLLTTLALACLMVLLVLPGRRGPRRSRDSKVVAEIAQLEQALMAFKARFGFLPPSYLVLREESATRIHDPESRTQLRKRWPKFDFNQVHDLNADGDFSDEFQLTGAECLVFFLGGLRDADGSFIGFSKNPLVPFSTASANREGPFFEFDLDRLTDVDKDGFPEYGDPLSEMPYLYASAERGGYRSRDLAMYPDDDNRNMKQVYLNAIEKGIREYQIISAGEDAKYGEGGVYTDGFEFRRTRKSEEDNITSFSRGRLGDF